MPTSPLTPGTPDLPTTPEARAAYLKAALEKRDYSALTALFQAEVQALPAFAEAMAPYFPVGHASFASFYATHKATLLLQGPKILQQEEEYFMFVRERVAERLWEIQQKKLFDLQCRWRADEVAVPQCRHRADFVLWGEYIDHCDWLPPITAEEVAHYQAYLRSEAFDHQPGSGWQNYDRIQCQPSADELEADAEGLDEAPDDLGRMRFLDTPAWYTFFDQHTGADALLHLPDYRTPREEAYMNRWRAERNALRPAAEQEADALPWPPMSFRRTAWGPYLDLFEPAADRPRLHRLNQAVATHERIRERQDAVAYWYELVLAPAPDSWPIAAGPDWRPALADAGRTYWRLQAAALLPTVWQEQEQNRTLGLPVVPPLHSSNRKPFAASALHDETDTYTSGILRGRELAGEPRDFNF